MTDVAEVEATEVALISFEDARTLTDQIKQGREDLWELIIRAYETEAWKVLEYGNWDEYVATEFGDSRLALPREKRREKVLSMRERGMSIRAIASATGKAKSTVEGDLGKPKKVSRNRDTEPAAETVEAEVVETEEFLSVPRPEQNAADFPDNVIGFGTVAAGAAVLDADVVLYYGGNEVGPIRPGPARLLAAALLECADRAEAAS